MKKNPLLIKLIVIVVIFAAAVGVWYYVVKPQTKQNGGVVALSGDLGFGWRYPVVKFPTTGPNDVAYSSIRDPGGIPQGLPIRLKIPIIGVNSAIEDALITPDGRMDVPAGSVDVAWFALGPHPGQVGSAVIGGHFGISNGVKFVFYDLDKLKVGDKVYIEDDTGNTLAFQVRSITLFNRDADATTVFTSDDGLAHLNLITCEGIWNQVNGNYPQRRVVFTDAIPAEGSVSVTPIIQPVTITNFPRLLAIGAQGTDVATLQTTLMQKGFLIMPAGVAKGGFGTLTRTAVMKYQKSVGLPATGAFDQATRAKLFAPDPIVAVKPSLPTTSLPTTSQAPTTAPPTQNFVQSLKSLYANPMDGLITLILLIAIIFVLFKIIRR